MTASCTVHLLSDIHLELGKHIPTYLSKIKADILVLAGDIGNPYDDKNKYANFIESCSKLFKHVILITGNHEYYSRSHNMFEIDNKIEDIVKNYENVHFLQRKSIIIDNIRFIGCTLWSLPLGNYSLINDFLKIKYMSIPVYRQLFDTDLKYLKEELELHTDLKTIVVTHHLPSYQLIDQKYKDDPCNCFFATNLEYLMDKVDYWFCGHTHTATFKEINGCKCYINPHGYSFEKISDTMFNESLIVDLY